MAGERRETSSEVLNFHDGRSIGDPEWSHGESELQVEVTGVTPGGSYLEDRIFVDRGQEPRATCWKVAEVRQEETHIGTSFLREESE